MRSERSNLQDDPLMFMLKFTQENNKCMHDYIENVTDTFCAQKEEHSLTQCVRNKDGAR